MRWPDSFPDICLHHSFDIRLRSHLQHTAQHHMSSTMTLRWRSIVQHHILDTRHSLVYCCLDTDPQGKMRSSAIRSRKSTPWDNMSTVHLLYYLMPGIVHLDSRRTWIVC